MTYNTIPLPQFSFTVVPEQEAEQIALYYFSSDSSFYIDIDLVKKEVNESLYNQDNNDDCIVILSYLINKATEKVITVTERHKVEFYTQVLHFLYRKIQTYGIEIPTNIFDKGSYEKSQTLLLSIHESLEQLKIDNADKSEAITAVQEEIKKSNKFLWLGVEDWAKILIGQIVAASIKEGVLPLMPNMLSLIQTLFSKMLNS